MIPNTPIDFETVKKILAEDAVKDLAKASIRELVRIVTKIETETGQKFIRMEMGVPGMDVSEIAKKGEIDALNDGVASKYATLDGLPPLKTEIARFVKLFLDIDVKSEGCVPTVGSLQGAMLLFMVANRREAGDTKTLFLDPGFPVHKLQLKVLGQEHLSFDIYDYRGEKLHEKLEELAQTERIASILYSNPNNPTWVTFTEKELKIIGDFATKYDIIVLEDLAYFGMDFRKDYSQPGVPPYQPTVAKYTDNWVMMISGSKSFSYAGQRIGMMVVSDTLFNKKFPGLLRYFTSDSFGYSLVYNTLYALTAGVPHTPQYGMLALLKAINNGEFNFREHVKVYADRAKEMKRFFTENGFKIVYDNDEGEPLSDGFYFTLAYPGLGGSELLTELMYYGISAIALATTGSTRTEGLRACVSQTDASQFPELERRLKLFHADHVQS